MAAEGLKEERLVCWCNFLLSQPTDFTAMFIL